MSGLLTAKRLLVTGVRTQRSIGYAIAREALREGAEVVLVARGRTHEIARRTARRLPSPVDVLKFDVSREDELAALADALRRRWDGVDGVVHAIAFAPPDALGGRFLTTPAASASVAFDSSAYSLARVARALLPLLDGRDASIVTLDFDASVAWPVYDWMGVAKAALEAVVRYLARDLGMRGVRVNAVSAGPLRTLAARGIAGIDAVADVWPRRAPLGWDLTDATPVARAALWLLSDWSRGVSGEIVHVDGGFHAMGADVRG